MKCEIYLITRIKGLMGTPIYHTSDLKGNCINEIEGFGSHYYSPKNLNVDKLDKNRIEDQWYKLVTTSGDISFIPTLNEANKLKDEFKKIKFY